MLILFEDTRINAVVLGNPVFQREAAREPAFASWDELDGRPLQIASFRAPLENAWCVRRLELERPADRLVWAGAARSPAA